LGIPDTTGLDELHCGNNECGRFLGYATVVGIILVKCHNCKSTNLTFTFTDSLATPIIAEERCCEKCSRFLYSYFLTEGRVVRKCRNCGEWNVLDKMLVPV